ncbi:MAG: Glycerol-3-phosphate dehydrogenase [Thermoanaerobacterium thermosaccharolyticum]|jgi:opine dehydrogenase
MNLPSFSVIGAGNGGQAMAAHLSLMGFTVNLYNRTREKLIPILNNGGIYLEGAICGFAKLNMITDSMEDAIRDVDIIMVTIPASGHSDVAYEMLPYLKSGQIIVLNPGRTFGAIEFYNIIRARSDLNVVISETDTFIYACRSNDGRGKIFRIKDVVSLASIPSWKTNYVVDLLKLAYTQIVPAENVLETSLNNIGSIFHPAPTLLNSARIETTEGSFQYYLEGISPSVAKILERMDRERVAVAHALGVNAITALDWLKDTYGVVSDNLYEAIQNTDAYKGLLAPRTLDCRYIFEDVPMSLVPISSIGRQLGISTHTIDSIIHLASCMHEKNYWKIGRTVGKLGLEGKSVAEIKEMIEGLKEEITVA